MPLNYSRWKHRITFSLSPVTTVADRWVTLTLPWRVGIRADYADIRFSDTAGHALPYNLASKTDRVTATVKIRIPTAGTRLIHLYFGNGSAASQSTTAGTEDSSPVLTANSGTTNPEYSGKFTRVQGGRLNQQGYARRLATGPYPKHRHRGLIKITNPVSQTNYQHKLILTWLPGMRNDFRDIRFAQLNGVKCDYWIESYTSRSSAIVWIEVPTTGQKWLNFYYGNGRAISESNGTNTFIFFDDFNSASIDSTKWDIISTTGITQDGSGELKFIGGSNSGRLQSKKSFNSTSSGFIQETKLRCVNIGTTGTSGLGTFVYSGSSTFFWFIQSGADYYNKDGVWTSLGSACPKSTPLRGKITATPSACSLSVTNYTTGSTIYSANGVSNTIVNEYLQIGRNYDGVSPSACEIYWDWIFVRAYSSTEPTLTVISHQPNSARIIPYETLGEQPTGGTTYVMDPIEFGITVAASMGPTILQPVVSFAHSLAVSAPVTKLITEVDFGYTIAGSVISRNYIPLDQLDLTQISVSKAVSDDIWAMSATIDGYQVLNTDVLRHATFATTDHNGVSRSIFAGIIPKSTPVIKHAANKTTLTGYDYAWYLAHQKVPSDYQHNVASVNPADIITGLLGGDDWEETTGIMPYKINQVAEWGDALNSKVFDFTVGTTKKEAITKICNYCRYVFLVKWIVVEGIATPSAYFVSEDDIDTDLDLPDPVTFTFPDPYLADSLKPVIKGDERYNRVTVIGRDNTGGVFTATVESDAVKAGDELAVEYIENSGSWTTQAQVNSRCAELFAYYSETAYTYTAKLIDRMDLELLQKIKITGYTGVSENWMRITRIKKSVRATNNGVEKIVEIEFTENVKWSALRRMYRYSSDDMTNEIETITDYKIGQIVGPQLGTVTSIDGQSADVLLESGETVTVRVV